MQIRITPLEIVVSALRRELPPRAAIDGVCGESRAKVRKAIESAVDAGAIEIIECVTAMEKMKKGGKKGVSIYVIPAKSSPGRALFEAIIGSDYNELMDSLTRAKREADKKTVDYHYTFHPVLDADFIVEG
jgi:hypothetical protein